MPPLPRRLSETRMHQRLLCAARDGRAQEMADLIARGADVNAVNQAQGITVLALACYHSNIASQLLAAGADINKAGHTGATPLHVASNRHCADVLSLLLSAGAEVNKADIDGWPPMYDAVFMRNIEGVKLLSSYGATRTWPNGDTAESFAARMNRTEVLNWLVSTRHWTTPLHHLEIIDAARARALLRDGANIHAASPNVQDAPTPVSLAQELKTAQEAPDGSPADLVLQAARPWSRQTHALFPARARERAWALVLIGQRLSRNEQALMDVWLDVVMPQVVMRDSA